MAPSPRPDDLNVPGLLCFLDEDPEDYGLHDMASDGEIAAALDHAHRHGIA